MATQSTDQYTVKVQQYRYTETVITDANGNEVERFHNHDEAWYDTESTTHITAEDYDEGNY